MASLHVVGEHGVPGYQKVEIGGTTVTGGKDTEGNRRIMSGS